jgi:hypothetical protein
MAIISGGRVLMTGEPLETIRRLDGRIWRRSINKNDLDAFNKDFAVISTKLIAGRTVIHVFSETQPDSSFEPVPTSLEDVYFSTLHNTAAQEKAA